MDSTDENSIPIDIQKEWESSRNTKYQWISCIFSLIVFLIHGIIFFWIPRHLRQKRFIKSNRFKPIFILYNIWNTFNYTLSFKIRKKVIYFKPSILILFLFYILLNTRLCYQYTSDITYIPKYMVLAKRWARIGIAQVPVVFLLITKGDFITGITGLTYERTTFLHIWFSFMMFVLITFHVTVVSYYWARPQYEDLHPKYPKNAYGIIAYITFVFLALGNIKIIRKYAYDYAMVHHRTQSFIMLLMAFFHNDSTKAMVVVGVHLLVIDKVVGRIYGIIHSKKSPTKGWSTFEILDDEIIKISIPIKVNKNFNPNSWFGLIKFKYGNWKAGQHIYFNVRKIDFFQHHPFTISSLSESGKMVLIVRKKNGFTEKMFEKVSTLIEKQLKGEEELMDYITWYRPKLDKILNVFRRTLKLKEIKTDEIPEYRKIKNPNTVILKAAFRGPSGAKFQPLITFDSVAFFCENLGASFILPVCLDLLQNIEAKEISKDYLFRPDKPIISIYWSIQHFKTINWYNHVIKKLLPFIESGKLSFNVYIDPSNEIQNTEIELSKLEPEELVNSTMDISTTTNPFKTTLVSKTSEITTETQDISKLESNNSSSSEEIDYTLINKTYASLNINQQLNNHISNLKISDSNDDKTFKSLAILSCGENHKFGKEVEYNLQNYRWIKNAPNIYFYNESYDS
ncbi:uncharacterized protein KGF55_004419 [Candida pseudojiufengensis]|uniref:uncharacterized protein n=1 Tax=Candida pseudojiufengensis TaxID=497109 RepID=UPI0022245F3A|nr:uncharacterized protein KGF55_004419 [Candida pseudojiufengensis]KAI5960849.1 hypothetical protein KGF55_004419 [Candida pseudojiufengensis]